MSPAPSFLDSTQPLLQRLHAPSQLASSLPTAHLSLTSTPTRPGRRSMKRSYQLYASEHHDRLTLLASPRCKHVCNTSPAAMQELRVCSCGTTLINSIDRCSVCAQSRQKRMSHHSYVLPERPGKQLTPPPSQPSSPRRSYEALISSMPPRHASASEVLTSALSSGSGGSSLFPTSMHRHSSRPNTELRRTSEASSIVSTGSNTPALSEGQDASRKPSRSATPDARILESGYAPMAAGFARLSRKNNEFGSSSYDQALRGRASSARPSLDLSARMFSGPA